MGYYSVEEMLQDEAYYRHLEELFEKEMAVEGLSAYLAPKQARKGLQGVRRLGAISIARSLRRAFAS